MNGSNFDVYGRKAAFHCGIVRLPLSSFKRVNALALRGVKSETRFARRIDEEGQTMERTIRPGAQRPRLLDQVRDVMRRKHYSLRTEESYIHWIKRFI